MPGRGAFLTHEEAKSQASAVRTHENDTGVSGTDTSAIGGMGRKGASGHGSLDEPVFIDVAAALKGGGSGMATTGETGYDSGAGRTFPGK